MNDIQSLLKSFNKARAAVDAEMLRQYPVDSKIEFTIIYGQRKASTGTVVGEGHDAGYVRVEHHQAKARSRYLYRDVHHSRIVGRL